MNLKVTKNIKWDSNNNGRYLYRWIKVNNNNNKDSGRGINKYVGSSCNKQVIMSKYVVEVIK